MVRVKQFHRCGEPNFTVIAARGKRGFIAVFWADLRGPAVGGYIEGVRTPPESGRGFGGRHRACHYGGGWLFFVFRPIPAHGDFWRLGAVGSWRGSGQGCASGWGCTPSSEKFREGHARLGGRAQRRKSRLALPPGANRPARAASANNGRSGRAIYSATLLWRTAILNPVRGPIQAPQAAGLGGQAGISFARFCIINRRILSRGDKTPIRASDGLPSGPGNEQNVRGRLQGRSAWRCLRRSAAQRRKQKAASRGRGQAKG